LTPHQSSNLALYMDSEPISYGLRGKTRAIAAVSDPSSSSVNSQFLAGTCSVRAGNEVLSASAPAAQFQRVIAAPQVHLIEFDDSSDEVRLLLFSLPCVPHSHCRWCASACTVTGIKCSTSSRRQPARSSSFPHTQGTRERMAARYGACRTCTPPLS
jgi:hypothetical protein